MSEHPSPKANILIIKDFNEWVADPTDPATKQYVEAVAKTEAAVQKQEDADTNRNSTS